MSELRRRGSASLVLLAAAAASGSTCAMSSQTSPEQFRCTVAGQENLPAEIGGERAVCSAIESAAAPILQRLGANAEPVSVSVAVESPYAISAATTFGGRTLAPLRVDISDRPLNVRSVDMLARAVAAELSKQA